MKTKILTIIVLLTHLFFNLQSQDQDQCHIDDWTALKALYESTDGENWNDNTNWDQVSGDVPPPNWCFEMMYGITFNYNRRVVQIGLKNNKLSGSIPSELDKLTELTLLYLQENQLSDSIPSNLGKLTNLTVLLLYSNMLSGPIPPKLGSLVNLTNLDMGWNALSASIPSELGNLTNLNSLSLAGNQISGSIPSNLGNLTNLNILSLEQNLLSDSIPSELGNLGNLTELRLFKNLLSGSIPKELGKLNSLTCMLLYLNELSGSIPEELSNLTKLTRLDLGLNKLSGNIPPKLGDLTNLTSLGLAWNELSGSIPSILQNLTDLNLNNNNFTCDDLSFIADSNNQLESYQYSPQYYGAIESFIVDTNIINDTILKVAQSPGSIGSEPTYQWKKNGVTINDSTRTSYMLNNIQPLDAGVYTLTISDNCMPDITFISEPYYVIYPGYDFYGQPVEYDQIMVEFDNPNETTKNVNEILNENAGMVSQKCNCKRELYLWEFPTTNAAVDALIKINRKKQTLSSTNKAKGGFNNNINLGETSEMSTAFDLVHDSFDVDYPDSVLIFLLDSGLDTDQDSFLLDKAPIDNCYMIEKAIGYSYVDIIENSIDIPTTNYADELWHGSFGYNSITANLIDESALNIVPLKIFDENGEGNLFDMVCAIYHAIDHNADIINISAGYYGDASDILESAVKTAREKGIFITAAAGNDSTDIDITPQYPAYYASQYYVIDKYNVDSGRVDMDTVRYDNVISIAYLDNQNMLSEFSNYGKESVTIACYGENIHSFGIDGLDVVASGSSMSTFFASKALALEIANDKARDYKEIWKDFDSNRLELNNSLVSKTQTGKHIKFTLESVSIMGCTDPNASNYFPFANEDDGSCAYTPPDDCIPPAPGEFGCD